MALWGCPINVRLDTVCLRVALYSSLAGLDTIRDVTSQRDDIVSFTGSVFVHALYCSHRLSQIAFLTAFLVL